MKHLLSILIFFSFMSVASADEPLTVFGIKMGDDVRNYKWMKDYTIYPNARTQNFHIKAPEPNNNFDEYWVWTSCGNNKIFSIEAQSLSQSLGWHSKIFQDLKTALVNKYGNENNVVSNNDTMFGGPRVEIDIPPYEIWFYETWQWKDKGYSLINLSYHNPSVKHDCNTDPSGL